MAGIKAVELDAEGWGCVCPSYDTKGAVIPVSVDCGEIIAIDPRGIGTGFRAKVSPPNTNFSPPTRHSLPDLGTPTQSLPDPHQHLTDPLPLPARCVRARVPFRRARGQWTTTGWRSSGRASSLASPC